MSLQSHGEEAGKMCITRPPRTAGQVVSCTGWPGGDQSWTWPACCSPPLPRGIMFFLAPVSWGGPVRHGSHRIASM